MQFAFRDLVQQRALWTHAVARLRKSVTRAAMCRLSVAAYVLVAPNAFGSTIVGGIVSDSQTWTTAGSPYIVTSDLTITGQLTINAGVVVQFSSGRSMTVQGSLTTLGGGSTGVIFRSTNVQNPLPGEWGSIVAAPGSTLSLTRAGIYSAGGNGPGSGALTIQTNNVTLSGTTSIWHSKYDAVHSTNNNATLAGLNIIDALGQGISLSNAHNAIQSCEIDRSGQNGMALSNGSTASLSSLTITNSGAYAGTIDSTSSLTSVTAVTATGNAGGNGILWQRTLIQAGAVVTLVPTTWYLDQQLEVQGSLTVGAGAILRFSNTGSVNVDGNGVFRAIGTSTSGITFTSKAPVPTAGSWGGIIINSTNTGSKVSYAAISFATKDLAIYAGSPAIDHTTFASASSAGLYVSGATVPSIINSSFTGNAMAIVKGNAAAPQVDARFNYFGAVDGPSGNGLGSGQPISSWVRYEPWLASSPTPATQYFNSSSQTNQTFNGSSIGTHVGFGTLTSGSWTMTFRDSADTVVRTFSGTGSGATMTWWGGTDAGGSELNGTYVYQIESIATGGVVAVPIRGRVFLDRNRALAVNTLSATPGYMSPNGDGSQDTSSISAAFNYSNVSWTLLILNGSNATVRTVSGVNSPAAYIWDGKNGSGVVQPDGAYTIQVTATDDSATAVRSTAVVLDTAKPALAMTTPSASQMFSNVYQSPPSVTVQGSVSDINIGSWILEVSQTGFAWSTLASGTTNVNAATLGSWPITGLANAAYSLRLTANDIAGNTTSLTRSVGIGNFSATQIGLQFNGASGGGMAYTSVIPFALTETIQIKNLAGQVVRTLVNGARTGAYTTTFNDVWNGRNDSGVLLPDGAYFYTIRVTAGAASLTWDLSNQYIANPCQVWGDGMNLQPYDPFNNKPLFITYTTSCPAMVSIVASTSAGQHLFGDCNAPTTSFFCPLNSQYQESGTHAFAWAGTDGMGAYRGSDIGSLGVVYGQWYFPKNAVVLFGSKPVISNVKVTPAIYGPARGTQSVMFGLTTYQNQAVTAVVTFENQESLSILRKITMSNVTPGQDAVFWDGRADNGMFVSPGAYTVTVMVTDSFGNSSRGQILTTIQY